MLEDHADFTPRLVDVDLRRVQIDSAIQNLAIDAAQFVIHPVKTAQISRLPRTGWTDQSRNLVFSKVHADLMKRGRFLLAIVYADVFSLHCQWFFDGQRVGIFKRIFSHLFSPLIYLRADIFL